MRRGLLQWCVTELDDYTFCTTAPNWVGSINNEEYHIGVVDESGSSTYYKALIQLDDERDRELRWRAWKGEDDGTPYGHGPDLPAEVVDMLVSYMDARR